MIEQLAPYPLRLAAFVLPIFVSLFFFVRSAASSKSRHSILGLVAAWSVICLAAQNILLGLPHHWDSLSLVQQLLSELVMNLLIFAVAGRVVTGKKGRGSTMVDQARAGFAAGLLMIIPAFLVGGTLSCVLTGDCI